MQVDITFTGKRIQQDFTTVIAKPEFLLISDIY